MTRRVALVAGWFGAASVALALVAAVPDAGAQPSPAAPTTTAPTAKTQYGEVEGAPRRFVTYVFALHDGSISMDGTDDFLRPDPDGAVIHDGSQWEGYPVMRPTATTIDGVPVADHHTVIALRGESNPDHDGIWEMSTDHHGVAGTYAVRTRWWNGTLSADPGDALYVQSGTPFLVLNGRRFGRTWWVTEGNGVATDVEPVNTVPLPATTKRSAPRRGADARADRGVGSDTVLAGLAGGVVGGAAVAAAVLIAGRRGRRGRPVPTS